MTDENIIRRLREMNTAVTRAAADRLEELLKPPAPAPDDWPPPVMRGETYRDGKWTSVDGGVD